MLEAYQNASGVVDDFGVRAKRNALYSGFPDSLRAVVSFSMRSHPCRSSVEDVKLGAEYEDWLKTSLHYLYHSLRRGSGKKRHQFTWRLTIPPHSPAILEEHR